MLFSQFEVQSSICPKVVNLKRVVVLFKNINKMYICTDIQCFIKSFLSCGSGGGGVYMVVKEGFFRVLVCLT